MTEYLDFCLEYFNKIHRIQERGVYSHTEISNLIKDIEGNLDKIKEKEIMIHYIDLFYKELPSNDIGLCMIQLSRIRPIFHRPLKDAGQNPLE